MLGWLAAYMGSSTTQATVHRRRYKNTGGLESLSKYKYVKQKLWTPFYEKNIQTEKYEIWLIFFLIMPTKYIKLKKALRTLPCI
jgi:hypothetical protein